jgi:dihydrofolate synthase/folylpolyglutamate synthase
MSRNDYEYSQDSINRTYALEKACGFVSKKDTILVGGTNGKSVTINCVSKLLKEEGFKVGVLSSSHMLMYNERFIIDGYLINNKQFTEFVNDVINSAEHENINATSHEILMVAGLHYFEQEDVDVVVLEVKVGGRYDSTALCNPIISVLTRVAYDHKNELGDNLDDATSEMLSIARKDCFFISAEQSKIRLKKMKEQVEEKGACWVMPVRKIASLPHLFESLYGRNASLSERIARLYIEDVKKLTSTFFPGSCIFVEGKDAPKTLKSFWREKFDSPRGCFEHLDREKPSILLDSAQNLDAFENLFLGIRLMNYQRPIQGLTIIMGMRDHFKIHDIVKSVRYLLRKVSGSLLCVPLTGSRYFHNPEELSSHAQKNGVNAQAYRTFDDAMFQAVKSVDPRNGLVVVCGDPSLISEYWRVKGIKKLSA